MNFTKEQLSEVFVKHLDREKDLQDLMELMIESMMMAERRKFLIESEGNKGNGFRRGRSYGQGRVLEFKVPRDRYGNFHPTILALLHDQEEESELLASSMYCKGLTQSQLGEVFGEEYCSIKRLGNDPFYRYYFTYLNYHQRVRSMIYTTNWIERLQKDFRRVLRMRGTMPTEESVIVLMAKTAMDRKAYFRAFPGIERDKVLFPDDLDNFLDLLNN